MIAAVNKNECSEELGKVLCKIKGKFFNRPCCSQLYKLELLPSVFQCQSK